MWRQAKKKKKEIPEHSLMFSFANVHSAFTSGEHLRLSHALLCYCCSQVQQAWASSIKYFCKDWHDISSDVLPKRKKWLLRMKPCSQPEAEVCSFLDNLRKLPLPPLSSLQTTLCLAKEICPQRQMPINSLKSNTSGHCSSHGGIYFFICSVLILFHTSHVEKKEESRAPFFGDYSPSCLKDNIWSSSVHWTVFPVMHKSLGISLEFAFLCQFSISYIRNYNSWWSCQMLPTRGSTHFGNSWYLVFHINFDQSCEFFSAMLFSHHFMHGVLETQVNLLKTAIKLLPNQYETRTVPFQMQIPFLLFIPWMFGKNPNKLASN